MSEKNIFYGIIVAIVMACSAKMAGCAKASRGDSERDAAAGDPAGPDADADAADWDADAADWDAATLRPEAGLLTLSPRLIRIVGDVAYEGWTTETKLFYSFWPADRNAKEMPLLVVVNGGPSVATSSNLAAFGMGPSYLDVNGSGAVIPNPYSFTALGNLLFIDTRQVGFSYGVLDNPTDPSAREAALSFVDFSIFTDAGDILLTVLRFLGQHPVLQDNKVVLLAESYGGARVARITDYLDRPKRLRSATSEGPIEDETLGAALETHFATVMPEEPFETLTSAETKRQFGWQILLQPGYMLAPLDPYFRATCSALSRDDPRAPLCEGGAVEADLRDPGVMARVLDAGFEAVMDAADFERLFGVPPGSVRGLAAEERSGAFRHASISNGSRFPAWFARMGELPDWDAYHLPYLTTGLGSAQFPTEAVNTVPFIRSLAHLDTFISNAYYDGIIASDRIPDAIMLASDAMNTPMVRSVALDTAPREGVTRPGWLTLVFEDDMGLADASPRTVRMPLYRSSGHMITLSEPGELREDIRQFLEERGAYL